MRHFMKLSKLIDYKLFGKRVALGRNIIQSLLAIVQYS